MINRKCSLYRISTKESSIRICLKLIIQRFNLGITTTQRNQRAHRKLLRVTMRHNRKKKLEYIRCKQTLLKNKQTKKILEVHLIKQTNYISNNFNKIFRTWLARKRNKVNQTKTCKTNSRNKEDK